MPASLTPAVLGFRAHAGWTAVVCLSAPVRSPSVVDRKRLLLTRGSLPCEPYHRAKGHAFSEAEAIVRAAADEARALATEGIESMITEAATNGFQIVAAGVILGSGRPDFTLRRALSTHAAMHNAEGWLNREAVMAASRSQGLRLVAALESDIYARASVALGLAEAELRERSDALGASVGPPWRLDQKLAAAAAWLALAA